MLNFKNWLQKEGLWLTDSNAEQTSGGVRAKRKSKPATPPASVGGGGMGGGPAGGGGMGDGPAGGGGMGGGMGSGLSLPPK